MKVKVKSLSNVQLFVTPWTIAYQAPPSMGFTRWEYWSGLHFLLQGIFLTQGSNPGLLHCRQMLYHLNHQGSPFRQYWLSTTSGNADCLYYSHSSFLLMESPLYLALESIKIKREWSLSDLKGWTLIRLSQSCYVDFNLFAVIMLRLDRWHNSD